VTHERFLVITSPAVENKRSGAAEVAGIASTRLAKTPKTSKLLFPSWSKKYFFPPPATTQERIFENNPAKILHCLGEPLPWDSHRGGINVRDFFLSALCLFVCFLGFEYPT